MRYRREGTPIEPTWSWRWKVIALLIAVALAFMFITGYMLIRDRGRVVAETKEDVPQGEIWTRPAIEPKPVPDVPKDELFAAAPEDRKEAVASTTAPPPPDPFASSRASGGKVLAANDPAKDGTTFPGVSGGGGCVLPAGTVIIADQENATTNTNVGPVLARAVHDVTGEDGCDGLRQGTLFIGGVETGGAPGQERSNYVFYKIKQPGRSTVDLEVAASDAMGRGGVPGDVNHHTGKIATRVAIASFVDILDATAAYFANPFIGAPMQNGGNAVTNWANQAINTAPTLTTDPSRRRSRLTIILQEDISV